MAQAAELVGVAQLVGVDYFVRDGAEGSVDRCLVGAAARHDPGPARTAGIVVARSGHHLAVAGLGSVLRVVGLAIGRRTVGRGLCAGGAFALALIFAFAFFAALLIFAFFGLVGLAEIDLEVLEQPPGGPGIGVLIADRAVELAEILADARLEPRAPEIDDAACRRRRPFAGQGFAGQQPNRFG